jgi:hypothetical protein
MRNFYVSQIPKGEFFARSGPPLANSMRRNAILKYNDNVFPVAQRKKDLNFRYFLRVGTLLAYFTCTANLFHKRPTQGVAV